MAQSAATKARVRKCSSRHRAGARLLAGALTLAGGLPLADIATAETVLTATQATYSLASALVENTGIEIVNVPADGRELALLPDYIGRRMDRLAPVFAGATAVIALTNALPGDPLYRFAREANIRIVNIDAALPWSASMPGVALIESPRSTVAWGSETDAPASAVAPYFWLSIPNAIRMADIIAHDLGAVIPESAATISVNLDGLKRELLALRSDFQTRLIETGDDTVFALTGDFVYLTNDLGLYVDGYFIKQDIRWSEDELAALTNHLRERDIRVVIHQWEPSEAIRTAIATAGASLVVLKSGDPGILVDDALAPDGLQQIFAFNLDALYTGFTAGTAAQQLPADLDPASGARLPYPTRGELGAAGERVAAIFARDPAPETPVSGPLAFAAYNPAVATALLDLHDAGVDAAVIDVVREDKVLTGLAEQDAAVIRFGRELLRDKSMNSATFAKAVELFGERGAMDLVAVMMTYAVSGYYAIAVDEHPPGQPLLEPLR